MRYFETDTGGFFQIPDDAIAEFDETGNALTAGFDTREFKEANEAKFKKRLAAEVSPER